MILSRLLAVGCVSALVAACGGGGASPQGGQASPGWYLLAGSISESGAADGPATAARFNLPRGLAVDAGGNVLVTDSGNHAIRKIAPDGTVTTVAGALGQAGATDGVGTMARLSWPWGIHVVGSNAYFGDVGSHIFRRLAADGSVVTLAGSAGAAGAQDGTGSTARFNALADITSDRAGNLYVSDVQTIRKVTPSGSVTTIAGLYQPQPVTSGPVTADVDGAGTDARFSSTAGLSSLADETGMYVSEDPDCEPNTHGAPSCSSAIRKVTFDGQVTTVASTPPAIGAGAALLPGQIATDEIGTLYGIDSQAARFNGGKFEAVDVPLRDVPAGAFGNAVNFPPGGIVLIAPKTFAVIRGSAVLKLVLP
jgi:hypothetical protein